MIYTAMYHEIKTPDDIKDLIKRKEYYQLKGNPLKPADQFGAVFEPRTHQIMIGNMINPDTPYTRMHANMQTGVGKTQAALNAAMRFIPVFKKIYAIEATKVRQNRAGQLELDRSTPSVFVFGFAGTKTAFVRDLLFTQQYGFTTTEEHNELMRRRASISLGPEYLRAYKEYYTMLRKRLTNKARGGFFKFFGYDEFALALFQSAKPLTHYEELATKRQRTDPTVTLEAVFNEHILSGEIKVNETLLSMFNDSLLICDEIHNTYNMNSRNNRGVAIQYLLDSVPTLRFLSLTATMINNSPTEVVDVVNYLLGPGERLSKHELFKSSRELRPGAIETIADATRGKMSFIQDTNIKYYPERQFQGETIALPHDVEQLQAGDVIPYLLFMKCPMSELHQRAYSAMETDYIEAKRSLDQPPDEPSHGATRDPRPWQADVDADSDNGSDSDSDNGSDNGSANNDTEPNGNESDSDSESTITGGKASANADKPQPGKTNKPQAKLTKARREQAREPIEDVAEESINAFANAEEQVNMSKIPSDGYTMYDMIFPNPTGGPGLYKSSAIRNTILGATQAQRDAVGIVVKRAFNTNIYTGPWLRPESLRLYSSKYSAMVSKILELIPKRSSAETNLTHHSPKIMIYHERVQTSGVLLIAQILTEAGFLDEYSEPSDNTICSICACPRSMHSGSARSDGSTAAMDPASHAFNPSRFLVAHSMQDRGYIEQSMIKYNAADNRHGRFFQIFIGSRIVKESYDFRDVRAMLIMSLPTNIPTMMQVLGRCVRRGSHTSLPMDERKVSVYVFVTTINEQYPYTDRISLELYRYIYKLMDYHTIQLIEREINRNCFDAAIHRGINMSPDIRAVYFGPDPGQTEPRTTPREMLGNLYFDPAVTLPQVDEITTSTWRAYRYFEEEIRLCIYIIKRLFMIEPAMTFDDIRRLVKDPPFHVELATDLISDNSIIIALTQLVTATEDMISDESNWLQRLHDHTSKMVHIHNRQYKIEQTGEYYVRFPVEEVEPNPITAVTQTEYTRDRERAIIRRHVNRVTRVNKDAESMYRIGASSNSGAKIDLGDFMTSGQHSRANYAALRGAVLAKLSAGMIKPIDIIHLYPDDFQTMLLAECVENRLLRASSDQSSSSSTGSMFDLILDMFSSFGMLITAGEVRKYKDVLKLYKAGLEVADKAVVGFTAQHTCRLCDVSGAPIWFDVSKLSLNRHLTLKENNLLIGQFETMEGVMKLKLRRPVQAIKAELGSRAKAEARREGFVDTRLIERGTVCETKSKAELIAFAQILGLKVPHESRVKTLCELIRDSLVASEIKARESNTRYAYIYSWWSEVPRVQM